MLSTNKVSQSVGVGFKMPWLAAPLFFSLVVATGCSSTVGEPATVSPRQMNSAVLIENDTAREIEVYGVVGQATVLLGRAVGTGSTRIRIPQALRGSRVEILFHVLGTEDWFRSSTVKVDSRSVHTMRIGFDEASGVHIVSQSK